MAKNTKWKDDYWLFILQLYLRKPIGIKPMYSRDMVNMALEVHVHPQVLFSKMCEIANPETPRVAHLWEQYGENPRKLKRAVQQLREMKGYGNAGEFYDGVETNETFEKDFRPLPEDERFTPVALILVLDLYFRLTPGTMVSETPEIRELARLLGVKANDVVKVMEVLQRVDPYLNRRDVLFSPLLGPCADIWRRYGNTDTEELARLAAELKEYYK